MRTNSSAEQANDPDQPAATEQSIHPAGPERGSVASDSSAIREKVTATSTSLSEQILQAWDFRCLFSDDAQQRLDPLMSDIRFALHQAYKIGVRATCDFVLRRLPADTLEAYRATAFPADESGPEHP